MWNAFMNGSGLHGGGAGGGYVPSQGWEFVPCARMDRADRGRGKHRNPLRRISSPPTVFSQLQEPQIGVSEAGSGTQLEVLRAQMWPDPEAQPQQQQTQHMKLKKELEDLKKRHLQEKEGWMHEKESLLREMADIQGGENRRILLDLKTVLEEVQLEVKREEEKRSELQLQYTRDRCSWELEKAELKCRIAQLEAREGAGFIGGVQLAAGRGSVVSQSALEQTSTLRREREEQQRLLTDAHSTAMDLRCRLEHNERDWSREKAELLERFDMERREWESQLKDMQKKIESLCYEVRAKREGTRLDTGRQKKDDDTVRLSVHSTCTDSSLLSDQSDQLSSSSQSEPIRQSPLAGFDQSSQNKLSQSELVDSLRSGGTWLPLSVTEDVDRSELEGVFHEASSCLAPRTNGAKDDEENVHVGPQDSPVWSEWSYGSDKKKTTTALNAALKEIARVSEELCSYQDEIRKKSGDKRTQSASFSLPEESKMQFGHDKIQLEVHESPCDLSQLYHDLQALEKENWITSSPDNTWKSISVLSNSPQVNMANPDRETKTTPGLLSEIDTTAPPIPPRVSSRNQNTPTHTDTELHIGESPRMTVRKCHSPCVVIDRKCSSPSIVRKFGAMLQENEGKVLIDGVVASCSAPTNSKCNIGCCHNRWSCDASKFSNKLSTLGTVQKSFSEVNILTASKNLHSDYCPTARELKDLQLLPVVKELPADLLFSSLERTSASNKHLGSKRNITLEQKTAEFNRTLFQAEMGTVADACSVGCQSVVSATDEVSPPRESTLQSHSTDGTTSVMNVQSESILSFSNSDSIIQEVQQRRMRCDPEGQEVRINMLFDQPQTELTEPTTTASLSPAHHSEVKQKVQTTEGPYRKTEHGVTAVAVFSEPGQNEIVSSSKNENPCEVKPQSAKDDVSLQQLSTEEKQRQTTQPGHKSQLKYVSGPRSLSDFSRPVPRIMNDHPWKPLTLAAYPRPEGSRSNYGALERILKNYETAAWAQQNQSQHDKVSTSPNLSVGQEETFADVDILDMERQPSPPTLTMAQLQLSSNSSLCVRETQQLVQENQKSSVSSSSIQKNFSRPACPANRRLPSRWASRSSTSSSTSSSPSTTPVVPPSLPLQKHTSSFAYSHAFHIETAIV
ncbi:uncharacterized protein KIAA0408-like isoform X2 [Antennarius striatus]|uniref:uncharacterized protein KIAA0408-like isoform X2 n=1 Tax=Antennarius striatus TaxID=241820 RepID=UPI0035B4F997